MKDADYTIELEASVDGMLSDFELPADATAKDVARFLHADIKEYGLSMFISDTNILYGAELHIYVNGEHERLVLQ